MLSSAARAIARLVVLVLATVTLPAVALTTTAPPAAAVPSYRILIAGDSITQGSSGDYTWRYRLWNKLATTAPGNVAFVGTRTDVFDVVNNTYGSTHYAANFAAKAHVAKWGDSFTQELGQIGGQVAATNANVLVVALGSNDLAYLTSPQETINNLSTYINQARAAAPGIDIVVTEVVNRWNFWTNTSEITTETNQYASLLHTFAAQANTANERVVVASTRNGWNPIDHTWDGTHPNPTGEALIAQRVSEALAQIGIGTTAPNIAVAKTWDVVGPTPTVTPGTEKATLGWSRVATGATGMHIDMKLVNTGEDWHRLPVPASGNGWTVDILAASGTYDFRIAPSKGKLTGVPGNSTRTTVGSLPLPTVAEMNTSAVGAGTSGSQAVAASWPASQNATSYYLSHLIGPVVPNQGWQDLPYPVSGTNWTFDLLARGRHYEFRVRPNRGFANGSWTSSRITRTHGLPYQRQYAALGDSYSAGTGTVPGNPPLGQGCARSSDAWPYIMQNAANLSTSLIACAGATLADIPQQVSNASLYFYSAKGYPELITMTVGGNDVGFGASVARCVYFWTTCLNDEAQITNDIDNLVGPLYNQYVSMRSQFRYADIIVGGYPMVLEVGGRWGPGYECSELQGAEREMAARLVHRLNMQIALAALFAGVWSVGTDVSNIFSGHGACSDSGLNDWIVNADWYLSTDLVNMNSFHPNQWGQLAYAVAFGNALTQRAG